jgi:hypothetical protein
VGRLAHTGLTLLGQAVSSRYQYRGVGERADPEHQMNLLSLVTFLPADEAKNPPDITPSATGSPSRAQHAG